MVRKALLLTGLWLLAYSAFIYVCREHIQRTAQTPEQRNIVKAEEFLYEQTRKADSIVVGSSMSNRLQFDSLPGHCYDLSMEGLASVDGLQLIAHSGNTPKVVLVEINTLDRIPDTSFFARLEQPMWGTVRKHIPFFRVKYQPVGVAKALLRDWNGTKLSNELLDAVDTAFVTQLVHERQARMIHIPEAEMLGKIYSARTFVQALRAKGTQIIFFEMPTDPRLRNFKESVYFRSLVESVFPPTEYRYIPYPPDAYQTSDGVHLPRKEGIRYTRYLKAQLVQMNAR